MFRRLSRSRSATAVAARRPLASLTQATCAATLALAAAAAGAQPTAPQSAPQPMAAERMSAEPARWARCNSIGRATTASAQANEWAAMERLAQLQLQECAWNDDLKLDAIENLADVAVMRGDLRTALSNAERCLGERAARTGCLITRAFVLAHLQKMDEARESMRAAQAALAQETDRYVRRRDELTASAPPADATPNAAAGAGAAAAASREALPELARLQCDAVDDYLVKLGHYAGVIDEMNRALSGESI